MPRRILWWIKWPTLAAKAGMTQNAIERPPATAASRQHSPTTSQSRPSRFRLDAKIIAATAIQHRPAAAADRSMTVLGSLSSC